MGTEADLRVRLESALPARVPHGSGTSVFCAGACFHPRERIESLVLTVDGAPHPPAARGMPRPDLAAEPEDGDAALRAGSGFWGTVPVAGPAPGRTVELGVRARLAGGAVASAPLGTIGAEDDPSPAPAGAAIAVCLATYDPDPALLRRQLDSLRGQSERDWACVVSDDCSSPELYGELERQLEGDPRFVLSRSPQRLGFYRNFERALRMVPPDARLVALCDQDDHWHPDKLATLRGALGDAQMAYSDARLVDPEGGLLSETMWQGRRNNHTDLGALMVTNTITGAASLFRRDLLDLALPFPEAPGWQFHDHWLGSVALAAGRVAYVERALYDYTQHGDAVLRGLIVPRGARRRWRPSRPGRAGARDALRRWKARYFYGYVPVQLRSRVLLDRAGGRLAGRKRRALARLERADRSAAGLVWLWARRLRVLAGRSETHGSEALLASGLLWRRLAALAPPAGRLGRALGAGMPPFDPGDLETRRWRRRRGIAA